MYPGKDTLTLEPPRNKEMAELIHVPIEELRDVYTCRNHDLID